ncbi:hypothetical protein [Priestia aryabhattai]|uniref:hypothetical protein n=1 Tax=Priestia aryabhattai TaxID=412384 RepID=UPI002E1E332D|nr:hypothetical protein [Priestia aryabhattai]
MNTEQENRLDNENSIFNLIKVKLKAADLSIWLSLSSLVAYGIYYTNTSGYLNYYGLTAQYIDFSLQSIAITICILIMLLTVSAFMMGLLTELIFRKYRKIIISIIYIAGISPLLILIINDLSDKSFKIDNSFYYLFVFILVLPFIIYLTFDFFKKLNPLFLLSLVVGFSFTVSYMAGEFHGKAKTNYLTLNKGDQKYVVIASYEEQFIIAPVDMDKKLILSQFQFINQKSGKDDRVELTPVRTGKLDVKNLTEDELK